MAETPKPIPSGEGPGYEMRDLSFRAVLTFLVFLLIAMVAFMLITLGIYRLIVPPEPPMATPPSRWAGTRPLPPPTEPRLQAYAPDNPDNDPATQIKKFQTSEDQLLRSYGWVNQNAGIMRIPINRAMELMIERGTLRARDSGLEQDKNPKPEPRNPNPEGGGANENIH